MEIISRSQSADSRSKSSICVEAQGNVFGGDLLRKVKNKLEAQCQYQALQEGRQP